MRWLPLALLLALAPAAGAAKAKRKVATTRHKESHLATPSDAKTTPAYRYAQLTPAECDAELVRRKIDVAHEPSRGVLDAVRLDKPLHGVLFRTNLPDKQRATTPYELADCRLVLALDDFAELLATHGIVEVRHYSIYRPPPTSWADDRIGGQHNGALALDAGRFVTKDGTVLDVDKDFHGAIDAKTCGPGAGPKPATPAGLELRAILCEAVDKKLFNVVLTPNYNKPHHNHFHLEVMAGVTWFLVH